MIVRKLGNIFDSKTGYIISPLRRGGKPETSPELEIQLVFPRSHEQVDKINDLRKFFIWQTRKNTLVFLFKKDEDEVVKDEREWLREIILTLNGIGIFSNFAVQLSDFGCKTLTEDDIIGAFSEVDREDRTIEIWTHNPESPNPILESFRSRHPEMFDYSGCSTFVDLYNKITAKERLALRSAIIRQGYEY